MRFALHHLTAAVLQPITAYCGILLWQSSPVGSERCRPEAKSGAFAGGSEFKVALPASSLTIIRAKR